MKLFLIRHGESENNAKRIYSGQCNPRLTQLGRKQAESIRPILADIKFDAVYSSDLVRARETCSIAMPDADPIITKEVREIAIGSLEDMPWYEPKGEDDEFGIALAKNRKAFDYSPYGGESADDVKKRIKNFLKSLEDKPYDKVAVFCHAGYSTIFLSYILDGFVDREALFCPNCCINVFEFSVGKWRLSAWNYGYDLGDYKRAEV